MAGKHIFLAKEAADLRLELNIRNCTAGIDHNEVKNVKKIKMLDAAKIMDIAGKLIPITIHAYIAMLFIRFITAYMEVCISYYTISIQTIFNCAHARKRVGDKGIHDRKGAIFTGNPNSRAGLFGCWKHNCTGGAEVPGEACLKANHNIII